MGACTRVRDIVFVCMNKRINIIGAAIRRSQAAWTTFGLMINKFIVWYLIVHLLSLLIILAVVYIIIIIIIIIMMMMMIWEIWQTKWSRKYIGDDAAAELYC